MTASRLAVFEWGDLCFWGVLLELSHFICFLQMDDLVMLGNLVMKVGDVVKKEMEAKPDCKIQYHSIDWGEGATFTCKQTHKVKEINLECQ